MNTKPTPGSTDVWYHMDLTKYYYSEGGAYYYFRIAMNMEHHVGLYLNSGVGKDRGRGHMAPIEKVGGGGGSVFAPPPQLWAN